MSIEQTFEKWTRDTLQSLTGSMVRVDVLYGIFSEETELNYFKLASTADIVPYDDLLSTGIPSIMKESLAVLPFILPANIGVSWVGIQSLTHNRSTVFLEVVLHSAIIPAISTPLFEQPEVDSIRDDIYDLVCDSGRWRTEEDAVKGIVAAISPKIYNLVQASSPIPLESLMTADLF